MHPYYIARAIGGACFLLGAIIGFYNIWMTIRTASQDEAAHNVADRPVTEPAVGAAALQPGE
jgi:cytochrome c oxidase cbb3-type subunit 1